MSYIDASNNSNLKIEFLSGLTVALALVPEAVAFAFIANVSPLIALYTAFFICIITAFLGGRPGMISAATGAIAVVVIDLVLEHGVEYLFSAVILMGIIQIIIGIFKCGKFVRLVPHPVMFGFLNGLAVIIFSAQLDQFKVSDSEHGEVVRWLSGLPLFTMIGLVSLTMIIIYFLPKFTKAIPSSLAAILFVSLFVIGFNIDTRTVGDIASISGNLPEFHIPQVDFSLETLKIIFPYSVIMALVGLIESLLTLTVVDEMTETRGNGNKECIAQGIANFVCGLFSGMGGCAMIGQSIINVSSGGRKRTSGIVAAVFLLLFVLFSAPLIEKIPMAALVGVMFMVSIGTFEWSSFKVFNKVPKSDIFVLVSVSLITIFLHNLALAVIAGVIISALVYAWKSAKHITANIYFDTQGYKHYEISGPLFFGSVANFADLFTLESDPEHIVVDFTNSRVADHSAIEALNKLTDRYAKQSKKVHLRHLSADCKRLLDNANAIIEVNHFEDPKYKVVTDG